MIVEYQNKEMQAQSEAYYAELKPYQELYAHHLAYANRKFVVEETEVMKWIRLQMDNIANRYGQQPHTLLTTTIDPKEKYGVVRVEQRKIAELTHEELSIIFNCATNSKFTGELFIEQKDATVIHITDGDMNVNIQQGKDVHVFICDNYDNAYKVSNIGSLGLLFNEMNLVYIDNR